jgi:hypothetical protein
VGVIVEYRELAMEIYDPEELEGADP